jgi:nitrogen fixation protein FixH
MNELVKAGYAVDWKKGNLVVAKGEVILPVEDRSGTPVLPNEVCLNLIDEIERAKRTKVKTLVEEHMATTKEREPI